MGDTLFGQLAAVGLVLLLLVGTIALLRRRGALQGILPVKGPEAKVAIRLLGRQALTAQHALFAVEVEGARFLVATHPGGSQLHPLGTAFPGMLADTLARAAAGGPGNPIGGGRNE